MKYIGKVLNGHMSVLEIIIYSILGLILTGLLFKWLIYDKFIKPKRKQKPKTDKYEKEE